MPLARLMAMAFRSLIDELHQRLEQRGLRDVRPAYGFVLLYAHDRVATARDVAALMGMTKQAAAKLIDAMESDSLVRRVKHPTDGRAYRLVPTRRGHRVLVAVEEIYREIEEEWAQLIGNAELERLRADLLVVLRSVHGDELPPVRPVI